MTFVQFLNVLPSDDSCVPWPGYCLVAFEGRGAPSPTIEPAGVPAYPCSSGFASSIHYYFGGKIHGALLTRLCGEELVISEWSLRPGFSFIICHSVYIQAVEEVAVKPTKNLVCCVLETCLPRIECQLLVISITKLAFGSLLFYLMMMTLV